MNRVTLANPVLVQAECLRVRERAKMVLAEARMLQEQLDQSGGLLNLAFQAHAVRTDLVPAMAANASHLEHSPVAA